MEPPAYGIACSSTGVGYQIRKKGTHSREVCPVPPNSEMTALSGPMTAGSSRNIPFERSLPIQPPRWAPRLAQTVAGQPENGFASASSSSAVTQLHPQSRFLTARHLFDSDQADPAGTPRGHFPSWILAQV